MAAHMTPCARPPPPFPSMFHFHNETLNVWTHFVGGMLFVGFIIHLAWGAYTRPVPPVNGLWCTEGDNSYWLVNGTHTGNALLAAAGVPPTDHHTLIQTLISELGQMSGAISDSAAQQLQFVTSALWTLKVRRARGAEFCASVCRAQAGYVCVCVCVRAFSAVGGGNRDSSRAFMCCSWCVCA